MPPTDPLYYYMGLAALVIAMIWGGVLAYRSWEEAHEELDPATPEELLDAFRQARLEGEMDAEEFARVREKLEQAEGRERPGKPPGQPS
ncbi:hypothetical protein [Paludisphaera soli]|uniref:hypothetical protein n=1 Tax=Paludisphaera soli TaxID=2712865 RepID=UPI0013EC6769|nr:hypothetical protein [Paludisphaera soli]